MDIPQTQLRVLTLNCWGIHVRGFESKLRRERMAAIGEHIYEASYEVVVLQEVWSQDDYANLCQKLQEKLPFSHYFYSGYIGSGVCVFSKYPISETMWHLYPLSGYAHKPQHGDWYGANGAGLCRIEIDRMVVHLYATHVHARYSFDEKEEYLAHRTTQMLNLGQFIKHTSEACDAVLLCGDLNTEDGELGYQLLRSQALLKDAWAEKNARPGCAIAGGETNDKPDNPFAGADTRRFRPDGLRIDYIMYRQNAQVELTCARCEVTMGKVPHKPYHFSDHEAVLASFVLKRNVMARQQPQADRSAQLDCLRRTGHLLDDALRTCSSKRLRHAAFAVAWFVLLVVAREHFLSPAWHLVNELTQVFAAIAAAWCAWSALVLLASDCGSLRQHKTDVVNLLNSLMYPADDSRQVCKHLPAVGE